MFIIQQALEKLDQIKKPYIVYYHPDDKKAVEQIRDIAILVETSFIDPGKIIVADRSSVVDCYKNWFEGFVDVKEISDGESSVC